MKKLLLKLILCATTLLAVGGLVSPIVVSADEGVETPEISVEITDTDIVSSEEETVENEGKETVEETESSEWFDKHILPLIVEYGADVIAFATVAFMALKDTQKTKAALSTAVAEVIKSNADNKSTSEAVQELKDAFSKEMEEVKAEHAQEIEAIKEVFLTAITAIREGMEAKVDDIDETVHKVLDVEKIAYGNNAHLVNSGTARRIAEVIGNGKKNEDGQ